jgi:hypothetical protein
MPMAGNPMFSQISQQATVGNSSIHENGPTRCQSIHWHYILAAGVQNPSSIAHISSPGGRVPSRATPRPLGACLTITLTNGSQLITGPGVAR